jgi:hypothetical protein
VWLAFVFTCANEQTARAQDLVPLGDPVEQQLSPPGISTADIELFGKMAYRWKSDAGEDVVHYVGDFSLHMGRRRASADEAVIWVSADTWEGKPYTRLDVFLWRHARLVDLGGTVTTGPVLMLTLHTFGKTSVDVDFSTSRPSSDSTTYQEATRVRERLTRSAPHGALEVVEPDKMRMQPTPRAQPVVIVRPGQDFVFDQHGEDHIATAIGSVYIAQGAIDSADFLEIRADSAVLYLTEEQFERSVNQLEARRSRTGRDRNASDDPVGELAGMVQAAYLEGDVVMTRGERMIRAAKIYYDFENERALILDTVMRGFTAGRDVPIYVRAGQVRQLSRTEFVARDAKVTTSEFHTPHYHVGADRVYLQDRTPRDAAGQMIGIEAGRYRMYDTTLNIEGVPITYWPYQQGDFRRTETVIRGVRTAYTDTFGVMFQTQWYLFNLLGLEPPPGFDGILHTDYMSERGPGVGVDLDYERDDSMGLFRSYFINDDGEDNLGGFRDNVEPDTENRGRILWRHRQYLPKDWQVSFEFAYISDPNFLESYEESEFDTGKDQETLVHVKKQQDNWVFTLTAQWRTLDYTTQTERLPDMGFWLLGEPVGEFATFYNESRLGVVRYRPDNRRLLDGQTFRTDNTGRTRPVARADTRNEIDLPLDVGPVRLVPYGMIRGSAWEDSPRDSALERVFGSYGLRGNMFFHRTYPDAKSTLFDVNGIRHIIKPDAAAWASHTNIDSDELSPFDEGVEDIDDFDGGTFGIRQRWQTKRGGPGKWRIVDWIVFDLEMGVFNNAQDFEFTRGKVMHYRPENSISRNYVNADMTYRISDHTALLSDVNWDMNDGEVDQYNISLAVERTPRLAYFLGWRYLEEISSNLVGLGGNYKISSKHTFAVREFFDLERGDTLEFGVTYIRKFPRWYVAITFELDKAKDNFGVSLSAWPEGVPQLTFGSREYSSIPGFAGIRP